MRTRKFCVLGGTLLCAITVIFVGYFYTYWLTVNTTYEGETPGLGNKAHISETVKPPAANLARDSPALSYCNFPYPDDKLLAEEGRPPNSKWILKQVQVVIRHGDRSPIKHDLYKRLGVVPDYCKLSPDMQPAHPSIDHFKNSLSLDQLHMKMQRKKVMMAPFPNLAVCGSATLSQLGVVQQIHNGEILRNAYVNNHKFLAESIGNQSSIKSKVYVETTARSRTLQSAIAFIYGLLPDFHLEQIDIKYTTSDIFTQAPCKKIADWEPKIKTALYNSYLRHKNDPTFRKLSDNFEMPDHAGGLVDGFVTGFLCKLLTLPCNGSTCVTREDLDVLLNAEEEVMQFISRETPYVEKSMLQLQPLLKQISDFMISGDSAIKIPHFALFSGHDTTLKPLIRALGIPYFRWPRLGTRLVFELWSDPDQNEDFVRILLNGKDYTMDTVPCQDDISRFCKASKFQLYIKQGMFKHFNAESRREACGN